MQCERPDIFRNPDLLPAETAAAAGVAGGQAADGMHWRHVHNAVVRLQRRAGLQTHQRKV